MPSAHLAFLTAHELPRPIDLTQELPLDILPKYDVSRLYIDDFDGVIADGRKVLDRICAVSALPAYRIPMRDVLRDHDEQRATTGQYHAHSYLARRLGSASLFDAWRHDFRRNRRNVPNICFPGVKERQKRMINGGGIPKLVLTKGSEPWQTDKYAAAGERGFVCVVDDFNKGAMIGAWQDPKTEGWQVVGMSASLEPVALVHAQRSVLTEDRQFILGDLPVNCDGIWINNPDIPPRPEHLLPEGKLPDNVIELPSLSDSLQHVRGSVAWQPANERATKSMAPRVAAWVPLRAFVRHQ